MPYDAFISYSHAADGKLAPALQSGLRKFAKAWNQRRAVHVFRDGTNLGVHPDLWGEIVEALGNSRYFVLLASPDGASSKWVGQEVSFWRENREIKKLLIVLTDGDLLWTEVEGAGRLTGDAAHPALADAFATEPLYLDLRWAREDKDLSLANPKFRDSVARISSELRDIPLDELIGEDVKQHKRTQRVVRRVIAGLSFLFLSASAAAWYAYVQRGEALTQRGIAVEKAEAETRERERADINAEEARQNAEAEKIQRGIAEEQTRLSVAQRLAVQGQLLVETGGPAEAVTGSLLVVESLSRNPDTVQGHLAWASVLERYPPLVARRTFPEAGTTNAGMAAALSADGRHLAVSSRQAGLAVLELPGGETVYRSPEGEPPAPSVALHPDEPVVALAAGSAVRLVLFSTGERLSNLELGSPVQAVAFVPDGESLVAGDRDGGLHILDVSNPRRPRRGPTVENLAGDVMLPALHPSGRLLMANTWHRQIEENVVRFWDLESLAPAGPYAQGDTKALTFSRSGRLAATGGFDDYVEVHTVDVPDEQARRGSTPVELPAQCRGVPSECEQVMRTPPISRIVSGRFAAGGNVFAVAIDPTDEVLAAANPEAVELWSIASGREHPPLAHRGVRLLAWVDEGRRLATVSPTEIRLWDTAIGEHLAARVRSTGAAIAEAKASFERSRSQMCRRLGRDLTQAEMTRYLGNAPEPVSCLPDPG